MRIQWVNRRDFLRSQTSPAVYLGVQRKAKPSAGSDNKVGLLTAQYFAFRNWALKHELMHSCEMGLPLCVFVLLLQTELRVLAVSIAAPG